MVPFTHCVRTVEKLQSFYHLVCRQFEETLCAVASWEIAAYINFAESGVEQPVKSWLHLTQDDRELWLPKVPNGTPNGLGQHLKGMADWAPKILWCGWPMLCEAEFEYRPVWRPPIPEADHVTQSDIDKFEKILERRDQNMKPKFLDARFQSDLCRHIMSVHEFHPIQKGTPLDLSQIFHGLAKIVEGRWGRNWAQDIVLLNWSTAQRSELLSLAQKARLVFVVLHTTGHWALMAFLRAQKAALLFDGKADSEIAECGKVMCGYLGDFFKCPVEFASSQVPEQLDNWSCGQRCLLHADFILETLVVKDSKCLPTQVPDEVCRPDRLDQFIAMSAYVLPSFPLETDRFAVDQRQLAEASSPSTLPSAGTSPLASPSEGSTVKKVKKVVAKTRKNPAVRTKGEKAKAFKELEEDLQKNVKFTHNRDFQQVHRQHQCLPRKGHWMEFLEQLHSKLPMTCEACVACRSMIETRQGQPDSDMAPLPDREIDLTGVSRKRGRPRAGESWEGLDKWLETHRAGIYQLVSAEEKKYLCKLCVQVLRFQRDGTTFVKKHEERDLHKAKLKLMAQSQPEPESVSQQVVLAPPSQPCKGALVSDQSLVPELFAIKESVEVWLCGGMPMAVSHEKGDKKDKKVAPLPKVSLTFSEGGILFRSIGCTSEVAHGLCHECFVLSRAPAVSSEIQKWSFKLGLIQLASTMALGKKEEVSAMQETICRRDYFNQDDHGIFLERLMKLSYEEAIFRIRGMVLSITSCKRNASLQAIIDTRLVDARAVSPKNMEKSVFLTLLGRYQSAVESGTCHLDEFKLAAQVAAGKLRSEPLVEALFKSSMHRLAKMDRGSSQRPNTGKFVNAEMALDLVMVLGRSKTTENFLKTFD